MITLDQAKEKTLSEVRTPHGNKILYGYNVCPIVEEAFILFFYDDGQRVQFYNTDCNVL